MKISEAPAFLLRKVRQFWSWIIRLAKGRQSTTPKPRTLPINAAAPVLKENRILGFYNDTITVNVGSERFYSWQDIIKQRGNPDFLERCHAYIQWLFPLYRQSRPNPNADTLNQEIVDKFRTSSDLRDRLIESFKMMINFYGLDINVVKAPRGSHCDDEVSITVPQHFYSSNPQWLTIENHNFQRISRILASMRNLGLGNYATAFYGCLAQIYNSDERIKELSPSRIIGENTFAWWQSAAHVDVRPARLLTVHDKTLNPIQPSH